MENDRENGEGKSDKERDKVEREKKAMLGPIWLDEETWP